MTLVAEILYTKTIAVVECPYCSKKMHINIGNVMDITEADIEAVKCPYSNCGKSSWLYDEPAIDANIEDYCIEEGNIIYDRE